MSIQSALSETEDKMKKALESLAREFGEVRTGRANPSLVEDMVVDYYGAPTPVKQLAAVSAPDAKTLSIQPWDQSAVEAIEKGIASSNLGLTPNVDGKIIRLNIPALSEERRKELAKIVKDMAEKGRVALRNIRRDANEKIKKLQSDNEVSEDDSFKAQDSVQKLTDRYIKDVDSALENKNKELLAI